MRSLSKIIMILIVFFACGICRTMLAQEKKAKKGKIEQFEKELE